MEEIGFYSERSEEPYHNEMYTFREVNRYS
jgi:hypothetical protein